jgi:hypothetical protein
VDVPSPGALARRRHIGVVREYMDGHSSLCVSGIDIVDREIEVLRPRATIVDPGPGGAVPGLHRAVRAHARRPLHPPVPTLFPAGGDHISTLLDMWTTVAGADHAGAARPRRSVRPAAKLLPGAYLLSVAT